MKNLFVICFFALSACTNSSSESKKEKDVSMNTNATINSDIYNAKTAALHDAMDKLWEDHITWTRNVICCLVDNLPGSDQAVKRLLENQDDIGNAIKPYYGGDAGKKLTDLLHEHIITAAEVVKAAKANNAKALDTANKKWYDNAD